MPKVTTFGRSLPNKRNESTITEENKRLKNDFRASITTIGEAVGNIPIFKEGRTMTSTFADNQKKTYYADIQKKIGFVCVGQMGGNLGAEFDKEGYTCAFINSSDEDLSTLEVKYKYHIPNASGCNHDREKGKMLVEEHYESMGEEILSKMRGKELVFFIFSGGGGTGSGVSPMLMEYTSQTLGIPVGAIIAMPSVHEAPRAHRNTRQAYIEMTEYVTNLAAVFSIDNDKGDIIKLNQRFAFLFNELMRVPLYRDVRGNMDNAEILDMLSTRGGAYITFFEEGGDLTKSLIESWHKSNALADLEHDRKVVTIGLSTMKDIPLPAITPEIGMPENVYRNVHPSKNLSVLVGLSFPNTRLDIAEEYHAQHVEKVVENIQNAQTAKVGAGKLDALMGTVKRPEPKKAATETTDYRKNLQENLFGKFKSKG